mmetsp:Transcript_28225/g.45429  ORF Transcript_28225/g.45429 Transcript_28225/m.45429 type:complete len:223 (-) Transcript_28225:1079-1747(-)
MAANIPPSGEYILVGGDLRVDELVGPSHMHAQHALGLLHREEPAEGLPSCFEVAPLHVDVSLHHLDRLRPLASHPFLVALCQVVPGVGVSVDGPSVVMRSKNRVLRELPNILFADGVWIRQRPRLLEVTMPEVILGECSRCGMIHAAVVVVALRHVYYRRFIADKIVLEGELQLRESDVKVGEETAPNAKAIVDPDAEVLLLEHASETAQLAHLLLRETFEI